MAKQRYINTKFWDDPYIQELTPKEKLLFIYSFTNPLTNIAGIYEITLKKIAFDTGIDTLSIGHILSKFEKDKKIFFRGGWLIVCNFPKHQEYEKSPKIKAGIELILAEIPLHIRTLLDTLSIPYTYPSNYSNSNSNSNNTTPNSVSSIIIKNNNMTEEYTLDELEYCGLEETPHAKNPYGKKIMAILVRKFAECSGIIIPASFDGTRWSKPLAEIYRYFSKDAQKTLKFIERASAYFEKKNLSFTPETLAKDLPLIDKWLNAQKEKEDKKFNSELYE